MKENQILPRYDIGLLRVNFNLKQVRNTDSLTQIVLSVNVNGRRLRAYSHLRVEPKFWNPETKRCYDSELLCPRVRRRVQRINAGLERIVRELTRRDCMLAERGCYLELEDLRRAAECALGEKSPFGRTDCIRQMKLIAANYHQHQNRRGLMGTADTSATYLMAVKRLENYLRHTGLKKVSFNDMDKAFFSGFSEYLINYSFVRASKPRHYTALTVAGTLAAIRNILHRAYDSGMCDNACYSMIDASAPTDASDKVYLTESEIARIANLEVLTEQERDVRDLFLIASYTALRISDLNRLGEAVIGDGQIVVYQEKTKSAVHIPILKEIAGVVKDCAERGFPSVAKGRANVCIKELARRAGISETVMVSEIRGGVKSFFTAPKYSLVSFHTARRSCITNLYKRGYSANYLMSLSGHKSIASFQRYVKATAGEMSLEFIEELKKRRDM